MDRTEDANVVGEKQPNEFTKVIEDSCKAKDAAQIQANLATAILHSSEIRQAIRNEMQRPQQIGPGLSHRIVEAAGRIMADLPFDDESRPATPK